MSQPDAIGALREVVECLAITQKEMGRDIAESAQAATELSEATEKLSNALGTIDELRRAVEQLGDTVVTYTSKLAELFDQQRETASLIGRYINDAAKQQSGIRDVDHRLRKLEELRVPARGG